MIYNETRKKCCGQCPFARSTPKEYLDTRGQNGHRFVGQALCLSLLPCHMDSPEGNADPEGDNRQCAGAAKFRANMGVGEFIHQRSRGLLGRLPPDRENVFGSVDELIAHHRGISVEEAREWLDDQGGVARLIRDEQVEAFRKGRGEILGWT